MKRIASTLFLLSVCLMSAFAQTLDIQGVVVDDTGNSVVGAAVIVAGSNTASLTDAEGKYIIKAGKDDILVFSSLGYEELRESVSGRSRIDVVLRSAVTCK